MQIELASPASFDKLDVTGNLTVGGVLEVSLAGGYVPLGAQSFSILGSTGTRSGTFSSLQLPTLNGMLSWNTTQLYTTGELSVISTVLASDFDLDRDVDRDDLAKWIAGFGLSGATHAQGDANRDGRVDAADFLIWQRQLGSVSPAIEAVAAVPEPAAWALALAAVAILVRKRSYP